MSGSREMIDEREIAELAERWGKPARHHIELTVEPEFWIPWEQKWHSRRGEVMFLMPRPGGLLLHRKPHYPPEAWRLLTGGIELDESVAEAIAREPREEVGLDLPVQRYVSVVTYDVHYHGQRFPWATHIFLLPYSDAPLTASHDDEIEETTELPLSVILSVAERLEHLPAPWRDWGHFRAIAHRVVAIDVDLEEMAPQA